MAHATRAHAPKPAAASSTTPATSRFRWRAATCVVRASLHNHSQHHGASPERDSAAAWRSTVVPTATALAALAPTAQRQHHHHQQDSASAPQVVSRPAWLEQAIPALVKQLSLDARNHTSGNAWVQVVRAAAPHHLKQRFHRSSSQHFTLEHRRLANLSAAATADVWRELHRASSASTTDGSSTVAVLVARPIVDPTHVCPLSPNCSPSSSSSSSSSSSGQSFNSLSSLVGQDEPALQQQQEQVTLQGMVDLDNCCGGSGVARSDSQHNHHSSSHTNTCQRPGDEHSSAPAAGTSALQELARQMVAADVRSAHAGVHAAASSSSSGSSSSEDDVTSSQAVALATANSNHHQPHHHAHHLHGHEHHKPRSRRRFLRRQAMQAQSQQHHHHHQHPEQQESHGTVYYGLAVQGMPSAMSAPGEQEANGCYVLKLSRNQDASGCTCTLFTCTHVCQGQPLYQQLYQSWLAPSFSA